MTTRKRTRQRTRPAVQRKSFDAATVKAEAQRAEVQSALDVYTLRNKARLFYAQQLREIDPDSAAYAEAAQRYVNADAATFKAATRYLGLFGITG